MPAKRDRRNEIAVAASAEFAARGFAGARVARIARQAGVNKQLVFYYFGSKAGLYESVITESRDALVGEWEEGHRRSDSSTELLRATFASLVHSLAAHPHLVRLVLQDAHQSELSAALASSVIEAGVARLAEVISNGQGLGFFREDADARAYGQHAVALAIGYLAVPQPAGDNGSEHADLSWIAKVTELLMRGLEAGHHASPRISPGR